MNERYSEIERQFQLRQSAGEAASGEIRRLREENARLRQLLIQLREILSHLPP